MTLKKTEITSPVLPKETVEVPALGGEVVVRGLLLKERMALFGDLQASGDRYGHISRLLAACVIDADGFPVYTEREWEEWGSVNFEAALDLFQVVRRLSGLDAEVVKKN